jgi:hypothetical protein
MEETVSPIIRQLALDLAKAFALAVALGLCLIVLAAALS